MDRTSSAPGRAQRIQRTAGWLARRIAGPGTGRPAPLSAVRMAIAMALPLGLGLAFERLDLATVGAIAALFTAIVEPGGGYRRHAGVYGAVAAMNVVVVVTAVLVAQSAIASAVVMVVLGVLAGLASSWGSVPTLAAPAPLGLFILTQGLHPTPRMADAVLAVVVGSAWVAIISVIPWPIAPFAPAELAAGSAWLSVASFARNVQSARLESSAVTSIDQARDVVAVIRSRRAGWSDRSHRLWATLLAAQRVTALLSVVADERRREQANPATRVAMDEMLAAVAEVASSLAANAVVPRAHPDMVRVQAAAAAVRATLPITDGLTGPALHQALLVTSRASAAPRLVRRLTEGADSLDLPNAPNVHVPHAGPSDWVNRVRATLSWQSTGFRHGVRLGVACGISMWAFTAIGPEGFLGVTHGSWVTITLMVVLLPTLGDSLETAIQRAIGTAVGGVIAVAMLVALPTQLALFVGIVVVASVAALLRPVNALWYVVLFTPIPLIFAANTGRAGTDILIERLVATGLACGAGLLVALVIWPTNGGNRLPGALATALRSDAAGLDIMIGRVMGSVPAATALDAQRTAMLAADEATRAAQAELMASLTAFAHPRPIIALETAVLRLPTLIAALGVHSRRGGVEIPGVDAVRVGANNALCEIAMALEGHRVPHLGDALDTCLDPAWEVVLRHEARGVPDLHLAATVDALDAIVHAIQRVADDAATWAQSEPNGTGGLWHRLMPVPRLAPVTPTEVESTGDGVTLPTGR